MGTPFAAASRETGGELQLMSRMGYDATTFGNHDFDLGPDGLAKAISVAAKAGHLPRWSPRTPTSRGRRDAGRSPAAGQGGRDPPPHRDRARRHSLRHFRGARQGSADLYHSPARLTFTDPIETAKEMVKTLRETEKVDVVIALSHGGVMKGEDGRYVDGEDVQRGQGRAGHRRGDRRPQPHRAARSDHRQRPHARGPDREGRREPRRTGHLPRRRQADGRVLQAPSGRRHDRRRPGHRRRDRESQEDRHRGRVRLARLQHRSAAGGRAAGPAQHLHRHRGRHAPRQPLHRRLPQGHQGRHRIHRQRHDARRSDPGKIRRADRLRRVRRSAARRRSRGQRRPAARS